MKIGVLICAYNTRDTVEESLSSWLSLKKKKGPFQFILSAVSVPFKEYASMGLPDDGTTNYLRSLDLDYLIDHPEYLSEAEARTLALKPLLDEGCDFIFLADSDEMYKESEINNAIIYAKEHKFFGWFSIHYKNYIFDGKTWIDGFCPPRIFKREISGFIIDSLYFDNDFTYKSKICGTKKSYKEFPHQKIPKNIIWPRHITWLDNQKSKQKVQYQKEHFKGICSYRWNDEKNCLEFNTKFYEETGQLLPILNYDTH